MTSHRPVLRHPMGLTTFIPARDIPCEGQVRYEIEVDYRLALWMAARLQGTERIAQFVETRGAKSRCTGVGDVGNSHHEKK